VVHRDLKATAGTMLGGQHGTVATVDLRDPDSVFPGQGLGQRSLHDVFQPAELMTVERQLVILRDTPKFGLELREDTEISIDDSFGAPDRFAMMQVGRALGADDAAGTVNPIAALMLR
jgi:hypothetical protein